MPPRTHPEPSDACYACGYPSLTQFCGGCVRQATALHLSLRELMRMSRRAATMGGRHEDDFYNRALEVRLYR